MKDKSVIEAKGRVRIEKMINGEIVDVYEKNNLVVDMASDIITKGMSGDPRDILWKSPYLTDAYLTAYPNKDVEPQYGPNGYLYEYTYEPNCIWKEYYYRSSNSNYVEYHEAKYPDKTFEDATTKVAADRYQRKPEILVKPEIYSTDVINFVGIGSGTHYYFDAIDKMYNIHGSGWNRLFSSAGTGVTYKGGVVLENDVVGEKISFETNANEIILYFNGDPKDFGEAIVKIDGIQYTNILDMQEADPGSNKISVINTTASAVGTLEFKLTNLSDADKNIEIELSSGTIRFCGAEINNVGKTLTTLRKEVPALTSVIDVKDEYFVDNEKQTFMIDKRGSEIIVNSVEIYSNTKKFDSDITGAIRQPNPGDWEYKLELDHVTGNPTGLVWLSEPVDMVGVKYQVTSDFDTEYKRAVISKPKEGKDFPHYNYTEKKVVYEAKFEEHNPNYPVEVKELALFNKPLPREIVPGSTIHPEKMFSIARIDGYIKQPKEALRIVWEITFS